MSRPSLIENQPRNGARTTPISVTLAAPVLTTPRSLNTDQLSTSEGFDGMAENLGIAVTVLVAQYDDRFRPGRVDHSIVG